MRTPGHPNLKFVILACAIGAVAACGQTLKLNSRYGSDRPGIPINVDSKSPALELKIIVPTGPFRVGTNYSIRVELHNTNRAAVVVHIPSLHMRPVYDPPRSSMRIYDTLASEDEKADYVVLRHGDYYGHTFDWPAMEPGEVVLHAAYRNSKSGPDAALPAWRGDLVVDSRTVEVIP